MGQIVNAGYVCQAIDRVAGTGFYSKLPVASRGQAANVSFLLQLIDLANGGKTTYGQSTNYSSDLLSVSDSWSCFIASPSGIKILISTNGVCVRASTGVWVGLGSQFSGKFGFIGVFGNGMFVVIPTVSSSMVYTSTSGVTWVPYSVCMPHTANWTSITYGGGKFVAVATMSNHAAYSSNGTSWNGATLPSNSSWRSVSYGNGLFVAVATLSNHAAYSSDGGVTWKQATLPSDAYWTSVTFGDGMFVAVSSSPCCAARSTDGSNWSLSSISSSYIGLRSVCFGNGLFVAVGDDKVVCSRDAVSWSVHTYPGYDTSYFFLEVVFHNGRFWITDNNSTSHLKSFSYVPFDGVSPRRVLDTTAVTYAVNNLLLFLKTQTFSQSTVVSLPAGTYSISMVSGKWGIGGGGGDVLNSGLSGGGASGVAGGASLKASGSFTVASTRDVQIVVGGNGYAGKGGANGKVFGGGAYGDGGAGGQTGVSNVGVGKKGGSGESGGWIFPAPMGSAGGGGGGGGGGASGVAGYCFVKGASGGRGGDGSGIWGGDGGSSGAGGTLSDSTEVTGSTTTDLPSVTITRVL